MRRFFKTVSIVLLCGLISSPVLEARGRTSTGTSTGSSSTSRGGGATSNPGNPGGRPGGSTSSNPGGRPGGSTSSTPGRPGGGASSTPAGRPNTSATPQRPANPGNPGGGPGYNPGGPGHNPGGPGGPGHNPGGPGHHPGGPGGPGHHHGGPAYGFPPPVAPHRPLMPPPAPYTRPVPPPHFRPYGGGPSFSTILGVTLGTALNLSINYLLNSGYNVTGYGNDAVYLNNVNQLNLIWPHATLYYNNGYLYGSEFVYSTPYYDISRYNNTYSRLTAAYGFPITTESIYGGMQTTWFGYNNQYVQLKYMPQTAMDGTVRYYTILSFGN